LTVFGKSVFSQVAQKWPDARLLKSSVGNAYMHSLPLYAATTKGLPQAVETPQIPACGRQGRFSATCKKPDEETDRGKRAGKN
jgi:hypothetical protein